MAAQWTISDLYFTGAGQRTVPPEPVVRSLVDALHTYWTGDPVTPPTIVAWLSNKFHVDAARVNWEAFNIQADKEMHRLKMVQTYLRALHIDNHGPDQILYDRLREISRIIGSSKAVFTQVACMFMLLRPDDLPRRAPLPPALRDPAGLQRETLSLMDYDEKDCNSFQNLILYLSDILVGMDFRRAEDKFFRRTLTSSGVETLAFEEAMTIDSFIYMHISHHTNFKQFKNATDRDSNINSARKHFKERPIPEAPDLVPNHHLRSYRGDEWGRGCGVYNSFTDMFFPYAAREHWEAMAEHATRVRARVRPGYTCTAPGPHDVCVIELDAVFPYDIHGEMVELAAVPVGTAWSPAHEFECRDPRHDVTTPELVALLEPALPAEGAMDPPTTGRAWIPTEAAPDPQWVAVAQVPLGARWRETKEPRGRAIAAPSLSAALTRGDAVDFSAELARDGAVLADAECHVRGADGRCYAPIKGLHDELATFQTAAVAYVSGDALEGCAVGAQSYAVCGGRTWVPLVTEARRTRAVVAREALRGARRQARKRLTHRSFVRVGDRYLRVDAGRTWEDCATPEIDHIYVCQQFDAHDRFFIYALKGRTLFFVGECDRKELTLFFEGVGGCGKTTVMKAQQAFTPPHLRGILSPNTEPKYGMASVALAYAIFCNEVSEELSIVQEEWQTSVSNEWGSYARKFMTPLVCRVRGQHFWIGNSFPSKGWRNDCLQVSRRMGGVKMRHQVRPRDNGIMSRIMNNLGALQRKEVLAYFDWIDLLGDHDPMSTPETLPPAFRDFFMASRRNTDPMEDFLQCGEYVVLAQAERLPLPRFRELYDQYRQDNHMGRAPRWSEAVYQASFNEHSLLIGTDAGPGGVNVQYVWGVAAKDD